MEYSLQQYAAMTQAQLFNGNQHSEQQQQQPQQQQQQQQQSQLQDPNSGYNLTYPPFPLIRMAPPHLHQPTLAKDLSTTHTNNTPTISPNTINSTHSANTSTSHTSTIEDLNNSVNHNDRMLSPVTPIRVTRPPNAYLLFNKEMRKILKDQDPTMKVADISKEVGSRWKNMPKEQKDQYVDQANKIKEEQRALHPNSMYIRRSRAELVKAGHFTKRSQQQASSPSNSSTSSSSSNLSGSMNQRSLQQTHRSTDPYPTQQQQQQQKRKKNKRDKNSTIPKHPLSAYMWYLTEVRPETMRNFPGSNVGQISKLCADRWNTMSEEARSPWNSKAQIDKDRYAREMQIYALQNDHHLGRGTRQKYRSAALRDSAMTTTNATLTPTSTLMKVDHHHHNANTNPAFDTNSVVPLFYSPDGKQHTGLYHHQLSAPESPSSILHSSLPMTLNPNALLQNHHSNNTNGTTSNDPYGNH